MLALCNELYSCPATEEGLRNIFDTCICGKGKLLPRALPAHREHENAHYGPLIDFLSCNACGLRYDAKEHGKPLLLLRQQLYAVVPQLEVKPEQCPHCSSSRLDTEELIAAGQLSYSLRDPRKHPEFLYCTTCNSALGRLPIDPARVAEYEAEMERRRRTVEDIH